MGDEIRMFRFEHRVGDLVISTEFSADTDLNGVLDNFEMFLKGCGFYFTSIDLITDEEDEDEQGS